MQPKRAQRESRAAAGDTARTRIAWAADRGRSGRTGLTRDRLGIRTPAARPRPLGSGRSGREDAVSAGDTGGTSAGHTGGASAGDTSAGDTGGMSTATGQRQPYGRRIAVAVLAAGAVTAGIVIGRHTLAESLSRLTGLDWTWFLLAIACEFVSLTAFGLSRRRLLRADGSTAHFSSVMAITYASNALSMTIPFAGAQLAVVFSTGSSGCAGSAGRSPAGPWRCPRSCPCRPSRSS